MENTSGQGSQVVVPKEVKGWNWGAFLLTWIWGIGNKVWLALIVLIALACFIIAIVLGGEPAYVGRQRGWAISGEVWQALFLLMPFIGFIMAIVLGIKGSEWAWRNKRWDSIDHFRRTQRRWAWWGIGLSVVLLGFLIATIAISTIQLQPRHEEARLTELHNVQLAVDALMEDNNLETLPNPVGTATNDMSAFPDATSVAGSADKLKDPQGNPYRSGDKNGYVLYEHDITGDGSNTTLVKYFTVRHIKGTYTVNAAGKVTQVNW